MSNRRMVFIRIDVNRKRNLMICTHNVDGWRNFSIPEHVADDVALHIARAQFPGGTPDRYTRIAHALGEEGAL